MKYKILIGVGLVLASTIVVIPIMADANGGATSRDLIIKETIRQNPQAKDRIQKIDQEQQQIIQVKPSKSSSTLKVKVSTNKLRYNIGDSVVISVTPSQDAYITIIDQGTSGNIYQIFPNKYDTQRFVKAHQTIHIPRPSDGYSYIAGGPVGPELIKVIASTNATPVIQDRSMTSGGVFGKINQNAGALSRDLNLVLKKKQHVNNSITVSHTLHIVK